MTAVARTVRAIPEDLRRLQVEASDPAVSAWVTANAGSGKTHVLAQRVIRLLLDGAELAAAIRRISNVQPDAARRTLARRLFAMALETPGGLKVQTIHAFCTRLLH